MNFAGGAVTLIFTVERFNSAIHHREAHFCVCPCRQAGGTFQTYCALISPPHSGFRMPRTATSWAPCLGGSWCVLVS
nr:MAG TPA: hypothetical protein [Caudoviricetes sp.]